MLETNNTNINLLDASVDTNSAYGLSAVHHAHDTTGSAAYLPGTLEADTFSLVPDYQTTVISGNGNIDYGTGVYDTLDLSTISRSQVVDFSFAANPEGGTVFDVGDGERVFDRITLADGRQVIFEGIENIVFADDNINLSFSPNDTGFNDQSNLHMMGVQTAWYFTQGTDDVLIGVQDSGLGVDATGNIHPDLRADETFFDPENVVDEFASIDISHGTAVQGIIGADANNGVGVAGINWNSDIYHIDVLSGDAEDLDLAQATQGMIDRTVSQGQKLVINMSLGSKSNTVDPAFEALVANNQDDVLFVISTGNESATQIAAPSSLAQRYDNVVAVGAARGNFNEFTGEPVVPGTIAEYSNTGEGITLVGPTTVPTTWATSQGILDYESQFGGTSAAAPSVAGVASLVWSANSNLDATQVKQIISETAYDLGAEGYDLVYGSGMVNADAAVRRAIAIGQNAPAVATANTVVPSTIFNDSSNVYFSVRSETDITSNFTFNDRPNDTISQDSSSNNLLEPSDTDLPTSLFNYDAPQLQNLAKLDVQLVRDDLFSSPLY